MQLTDVPSPDDDDSERSENAILNLMKKQEPQLHQIGDELGLNICQPNTLRRVISYCYRQNIFFWSLQGVLIDSSSSDDMQNCIKQMRQLNSNNVEDLIKTALLAHQLGIQYRMEWLSL